MHEPDVGRHAAGKRLELLWLARLGEPSPVEEIPNSLVWSGVGHVRTILLIS